MKRFFYPLLIAAIVTVLGVEVYKQLTKKGPKSDRIPCHKEVVTFEKVFDPKRLQLLGKALQRGVTLHTRVQKSHYMQSQLFERISQRKIRDLIVKRLGQDDINVVQSGDVELNVLIYENDKKDPKKKTKKAKLYAGYLLFDYKLDGKLVYKFQIDFMDMQGRDIAKRIDCAVTSLQTITK